MKKVLAFLAVVYGLVFSVALFAQGEAQPDYASFLSDALKLVGGMKGMGVLAAAVAVCQLLVKAFDLPLLANVASKWKLLAVALVSLFGAVVQSMVSGWSWSSVLMNGLVLSALQVLAHQVYSQFIEKKPLASVSQLA